MRHEANLSDEKLAELVRDKDQELYRELVFRYQKKLFRYANYLIGDRDEAADIVQEAFVKAFINLKSFDAKKKFSSWIYRIVHNQAVNQLKKQAKKISLEKNSWTYELLKSKEDPEKSFDQKETRKMVTAFLKKLPLKYRSVLTLFYLEERSYEEISDILRMPIGTVGVQISRGKKIMKEIYEKEDEKNA